MHDLPGKFIGILIAFFGCVVLPIVNNSVATELQHRRQVITECYNLLDEVIDSKVYTPEMQKQFTNNLAAYGAILDFEVVKEKKSNDAVGEGKYRQTYTVVPNADASDGVTDGIVHFATGDRVGIKVLSISYTNTQYIAKYIAHVFLPEYNYSLYERVR